MPDLLNSAGEILTGLIDAARSREPITVAGVDYVPADQTIDRAAVVSYLRAREIGSKSPLVGAICEGLRTRILRGDFAPATTPKGT